MYDRNFFKFLLLLGVFVVCFSTLMMYADLIIPAIWLTVKPFVLPIAISILSIFIICVLCIKFCPYWIKAFNGSGATNTMFIGQTHVTKGGSKRR